MKEVLFKILGPALGIVFGLGSVIISLTTGQTAFFLLGGTAILLVSVLTLLNVLDILGGAMRKVLVAFFGVLAAGLVFADFYVIKKPLDFQAEKDRRYEYVVQRLKDIRTAQVAYKNVRGGYCNNFDSLLAFVEQDSFLVIRAVGEVPDTLTEEEAVELQLVFRDTFQVSVKDSIFSRTYLKERKFPFSIDSIPYVPYTSGAKFLLAAGRVERNNVKVAVFEAKDGKPFDPTDVMTVGSMTDPTTNGNWGE